MVELGSLPFGFRMLSFHKFLWENACVVPHPEVREALLSGEGLGGGAGERAAAGHGSRGWAGSAHGGSVLV